MAFLSCFGKSSSFFSPFVVSAILTPALFSIAGLLGAKSHSFSFSKETSNAFSGVFTSGGSGKFRGTINEIPVLFTAERRLNSLPLANISDFNLNSFTILSIRSIISSSVASNITTRFLSITLLNDARDSLSSGFPNDGFLAYADIAFLYHCTS